MFEFRDLQCFMTIVEYRGFGRAAVALGMTQPALSRRIGALERSLGVRLFSRERRQIELTPAGKVFAREAMALLAQAESARRVLSEATGGSKGELKIGTRSSARFAVIMEAIRRFRVEYPEVSITVTDPLKLFEFEQMLKGDFDIAIMRGPVDSRRGLRVERLRDDPLVIALPERHRLAGRPVVEVSDLARELFVEIALHRGYGTKELVRGVCAAAGFRPNVVQEVDTVDMLVMCVAAGIGVALMYDASRELPMHGIVYRPIHPARESVPLCAVWRADDSNPALLPFVRHLKDVAESLDDVEDDVPATM